MWSPRTLENKARYGSNEFQPDTKSFLYTNSANIIRAGFNERRYQQGYPKYSFHNPVPKSRSREYIITRESQLLGSNRALENKENQRPANIQVPKTSFLAQEAKETYFGSPGGVGSPNLAGKDGGSQGRLVLAPRPPKGAGLGAYSSNPHPNADFFRRQSSHADRRPSLRQITTIRDVSSRDNEHEMRLLERSRSRPTFLVNTQPELQYSNIASNVSRSPPPVHEKAFYLMSGIPKAPLSSKGSTSPTNYIHKRENTNLTVVPRTPFTAKDSSVSLERSQLVRSGSVEHKGSVLVAPNSAVVVKSLADLDFDREVGKGSYAVVKLAYSKPAREKLAVKIYEKSKLSDPLKRKSVDREIAILQVMNHPYVIKYVAHFENKFNIHLVMEYPGHKSLYEHVKSQPMRRVTETECKSIMKKIFGAVHYFHSKDVAHRDLKLENLLYLSDGSIKIIDFGFAIRTKEKQKTFCGTPTYMAPEIVKRLPYRAPDVDIWALGIMMFRMMTGVYPFMANNDKDLYKKIVAGVYDSHLLPSPKARDLVARILRVKAEERILARDVESALIQLLSHEWFDETLDYKGREW